MTGHRNDFAVGYWLFMSGQPRGKCRNVEQQRGWDAAENQVWQRHEAEKQGAK